MSTGARSKNQVYDSQQAATDLSAHRYTLMRLSAAGYVNVASDANNTGLFGVLVNKPSSGQTAKVMLSGIGPVVAGAAITVNALLTHNGSGRVTAAVSGTNVNIIGRALQAATADGEEITAEIFRPYRYPGLAV